MFEFLKKKISDFTGKLKGTIEGKKAEQQTAKQVETEKQIEETENLEPDKEILQESAETDSKTQKARTEPQVAPEISDPEIKEETLEKIGEPENVEGEKVAKKQPEKKTSFLDKLFGKKEAREKSGAKEPEIETEKLKKEKREPKKEQPAKSAQEQAELHVAKSAQETFEVKIAGEDKSAIEKVLQIREDEKREMKAKVGIGKKIFGILGGKIKISESEIGDFFDEFELSLLEGDVEQNAAQAIVSELKSRLIGKEISTSADVTEFVKGEVRASLETIMHTGKIDVLQIQNKPTKILFLGPNGAGKTTSIAKVATYLMSKGKSVILAAGDTFRAASIEQLEEHANKIGVKVVKHKYGSDPAAVAFDAVKAAQAKGIDYVLIDTAGRQETNMNLIGELKKIERVVKPDLKIYVGEAYTGQALLQQAQEFDKAIGISGFILTKIDTDTKGGTAISLIYALKKPIIFVGTGQRYSDLLEFKPEFIINRVV